MKKRQSRHVSALGRLIRGTDRCGCGKEATGYRGGVPACPDHKYNLLLCKGEKTSQPVHGHSKNEIPATPARKIRGQCECHRLPKWSCPGRG